MKTILILCTFVFVAGTAVAQINSYTDSTKGSITLTPDGFRSSRSNANNNSNPMPIGYNAGVYTKTYKILQP